MRFLWGGTFAVSICIGFILPFLPSVPGLIFKDLLSKSLGIMIAATLGFSCCPFIQNVHILPLLSMEIGNQGPESIQNEEQTQVSNTSSYFSVSALSAFAQSCTVLPRTHFSNVHGMKLTISSCSVYLRFHISNERFY